MEVDTSASLLLPLADVPASGGGLVASVILLILAALAALYRYAHISFNVQTSYWRSEWAPSEDKPGKRSIARVDRTVVTGISLGLASGLFRLLAVVWAAWMTAGAVLLRGGPAWLFILGISIIMALAFSLADLLIKRFVARTAAEKPSHILQFLTSAASSVLFLISAPLSRLAVVRTVAAQIKAGEDLISEAEDIETGVLEEDEEQLGDYIAEFRETEVREIMTSRMDIVAISRTATLADVVETISRSGHSRLPIFRDHLDHIEGILYVKDLLPLLTKKAEEEVEHWTSMAREPLLVSADQAIVELLRAFKVKRMHMAIVVDEYGGTEGLVTLEDIIEELVGDIRDEFDHDEPDLYQRIEEGLFRFDARIDLDEFVVVLEESTGLDLFLDTDEFDFETLGGLIQHLTESVPMSGIEVDWNNLHMQVEDVEQHRIGHVLVRIREQVPEQHGADIE